MITAIVTAFLSYFLFQKSITVKINSDQRVQEIQKEEWKYVLENIGRPYGDKRLIRINSRTGEDKVLIESLNNIVPNGLLINLFLFKDSAEKNDVVEKGRKLLQTNEREFWEDFSLEKFSFPKDSQKLFFYLAYPANISFPNLISYDLETQKFKVMSINSYYRESFMEKFLSVDGKLLLVPSTDESRGGLGLSRKIWLLDLENDTARLVVQLNNNETLDRKNEGEFYIRWLDNNSFEYSVYDQSTLITNKSLIEIKKAVIN